MNYRSAKNPNLSKYINHSPARFLIILAVIISIVAITPFAAASELDEFEEAATSDKTQQEDEHQDEQDDGDDRDDDDCNFFSHILGMIFETFIDVFCLVISDGAKKSLARVEESTETVSPKIEIRQTGEPTLPFFQLEHKYLRVDSDITAQDDSIELGYGPFGFNCRHTDFSEKKPSDELTLTQYHLLLRISATDTGEFGIGMGALTIHGNDDNSGFSLTFPIKIYPKESFGIRFKPTYSWINGNSIDDYDISLAYTKRYGSLQLGYRFLEANGVNLDGSYIGFAVHY